MDLCWAQKKSEWSIKETPGGLRLSNIIDWNFWSYGELAGMLNNEPTEQIQVRRFRFKHGVLIP